MSVATHILLATDFSEAADGAVNKAGELASILGVKLTVLHVHPRPPAAPEAPIPSERQISSTDLAAEAVQALEGLKSTKLSSIESVALITVEHASAALAICDYAGRHGVDLIVVGTHGRTGLAHFLIGSVAEKVVRHATCAVLVVPDGKGRPSA
jgi:nucleotide-binding universal stress UspA family protein